MDYSLTHSCYDPTPEGLACGRCDSCRIRRSAFDRLGLADPIAYADARVSGIRPDDRRCGVGESTPGPQSLARSASSEDHQ